MNGDVPDAVHRDDRLLLAWHALDEIDTMSVAAFQAGCHRVQIKADGSPVTDLELAIERVLVAGIRVEFPDDSVLGEESGLLCRGAGRWIIDPIDGTSNLLEGVPLYAHMVAYVHAGSMRFAVVSAPALRARWWACRGAGAFRGNERIAVSRKRDIAEARLGYGGLRDYDECAAAGMVRLARRCLRSRGFGNFLPHMLVAEGTYDLASSGRGGGIWDIAPLALIVREAGGRITSLAGLERYGSGPILTSNSILHPAALAVVSLAA